MKLNVFNKGNRLQCSWLESKSFHFDEIQRSFNIIKCYKGSQNGCNGNAWSQQENNMSGYMRLKHDIIVARIIHGPLGILPQL